MFMDSTVEIILALVGREKTLRMVEVGGAGGGSGIFQLIDLVSVTTHDACSGCWEYKAQ